MAVGRSWSGEPAGAIEAQRWTRNHDPDRGRWAGCLPVRRSASSGATRATRRRVRRRRERLVTVPEVLHEEPATIVLARMDVEAFPDVRRLGPAGQRSRHGVKAESLDRQVALREGDRAREGEGETPRGEDRLEPGRDRRVPDNRRMVRWKQDPPSITSVSPRRWYVRHAPRRRRRPRGGVKRPGAAVGAVRARACPPRRAASRGRRR